MTPRNQLFALMLALSATASLAAQPMDLGVPESLFVELPIAPLSVAGTTVDAAQ